MMTRISALNWPCGAFLTILSSVVLAFVTGLWLVVAAACIYVLAWTKAGHASRHPEHSARHTSGTLQRRGSVLARVREECKGWGQ